MRFYVTNSFIRACETARTNWTNVRFFLCMASGMSSKMILSCESPRAFSWFFKCFTKINIKMTSKIDIDIKVTSLIAMPYNVISMSVFDVILIMHYNDIIITSEWHQNDIKNWHWHQSDIRMTSLVWCFIMSFQCQFSMSFWLWLIMTLKLTKNDIWQTSGNRYKKKVSYRYEFVHAVCTHPLEQIVLDNTCIDEFYLLLESEIQKSDREFIEISVFFSIYDLIVGQSDSRYTVSIEKNWNLYTVRLNFTKHLMSHK